MKRTITICCTFALLIAASSVAGASDSKWIIRGNYVQTWSSTDSYQTESVIGDDSIFTELSVDNGQGFGLDIEYKVNSRLGVLLTGIFTDLEGTFVYGIEPGEASQRLEDNNTVAFHQEKVTQPTRDCVSPTDDHEFVSPSRAPGRR